MHLRTIIALSSLSLLTLGACSPKRTTTPAPKTPVTDQPSSSDNPLLITSSLPYHAPEFTKIRTEHFLPALHAGIAQQNEEIEAIVANPEAPTVENTLEALEKSGEILRRSGAIFGSLSGTMADEAMQAVESEYVPKLSAHADSIYLNPKLFARVEKIHQSKDSLQGEAKRLAEQYYRRFVRAGAKLTPEQQVEIRKINGELSKLQTSFGQNLLSSYETSVIDVADKAQLAGLADDEIAALAATAKEAGLPDGSYRIKLLNTTIHPLLSKLDNRELREKIFRTSSRRASANDTLLREIVALRAKKAKLLGYSTWANYVLDAQMAKKPEAVFAMLKDLAPQSMAKSKAEADELRKEIAASGQKHELAPWDWFYYGEKLRKNKYNFDGAKLRPYLELDRVLKDGLFFAMNQLFGITFKERKDLPTYHPDVRTFEVFDNDGSSIGLFYADYFARKGKRGGAWMMELVGQNDLMNEKPVVVNCANFDKPAKGEPVLLSFDNVITMFHEMGHGVHGLLSAAKYPSLAGTNVPRDYVEFPSQFQEDWAMDPKVFANYAKHYQTGELMPQALMDAMKKASSFNKGYEALEYLKSSLLDMAWHDIAPGAKVEEVDAFEQATFKKYGVDDPLVLPRYRSPYFSHVFAGGYSAGYYSYIWTEVLAADAFASLKDKGGLSRANGDRFRKLIISRGDTIDPMQQYVEFRGEKPKVDALLERRGLKAQ